MGQTLALLPPSLGFIFSQFHSISSESALQVSGGMLLRGHGGQSGRGKDNRTPEWGGVGQRPTEPSARVNWACCVIKANKIFFNMRHSPQSAPCHPVCPSCAYWVFAKFAYILLDKH